MKKSIANGLVKALSYILVAALACVVTIILVLPTMKYYDSYVPLREPTGELKAQTDKLTELMNLIDTGYIGDADLTLMGDAAAEAMVAATGDRWSYYISAADMDSYLSQTHNAYVGIGITITAEDTSKGFPIERVDPGGSAQKAGILPGDILIEAEGQSLLGVESGVPASIIRGEEGTSVTVNEIGRAHV